MSEVIVGVKPGRAPEAQDALALGSLIAQARDDRLVAVSVAGPAASLPDCERDLGLAIAETEQRAGDLRPVDALALQATSPAWVLHELGEDRDCHAIVLGSSQRAARGALVPGMVAGRLLHGSAVPVVVATRGFAHTGTARLGTIGVAFIDTPEAHAALDHATRLAAGAHARLRIISVFDGLLARAPSLEIDREGRRARARKTLDDALAAVSDQAQAEAVWREGEPGDALTDATAELDLIVVGPRGYGPVRAVLLGGVSGLLFQESACPVLAVPRPAGGGRPVCGAAASGPS